MARDELFTKCPRCGMEIMKARLQKHMASKLCRRYREMMEKWRSAHKETPTALLSGGTRDRIPDSTW